MDKDVSKLLSTTASLMVQASVYCPHCGIFVDLYNLEDNEEISLANSDCPCSNEYDNFFSTPGLINGSESFLVDNFEIE